MVQKKVVQRSIFKKNIIICSAVVFIFFISALLYNQKIEDVTSSNFYEKEAAQSVLKEGEKEFKKDTLLVSFYPGVAEENKEKIFKKYGASVKKAMKTGTVVINVNENQLEKIQGELNQHKEVRYAERDYSLPPSRGGVVVDDYYINQREYSYNTYYVSHMLLPDAWSKSKGLVEVRVANPDTGILLDHPDLKNVLLLDLAYNAYDGSNNVMPIMDPVTVYTEHGTITAGLLASETNNGIGIASAPWYKKVIPIKVSFDASGRAYTSDLAEAIVYAADNGAKVVSVSYDAGDSLIVNDAGNYLKQKGGLLFSAAGNGDTLLDYPNYDGLILVSATNYLKNRAVFSNYGTAVDLAAPGDSILSTTFMTSVFPAWDGTGYGPASGTSVSCPLAASVAALLFSAFPNASPAQVETALKRGATDLGETGYDIEFGWGLVNAAGSMGVIEAMPTVDSELPSVNIKSPLEGALLSTSIKVDVEASDSNGVSRVELWVDEVFYDGTYLGTNGLYSIYWNVQTVADGVHTLTAKAYDSSGNVNAQSVQVTLQKDESQPYVKITYPNNGAVIKSKTKSLTITTETSGNTAEVDFKVIGEGTGFHREESGTDSVAPFTYRISPGLYKGSNVTVTAVASSASGITSSDQVNFIIT